jgi:cytochrome c553
MNRSIIFLGTLLVSASAMPALTPQQSRGKEIYFRGEAAAPITALSGSDGFGVPASVMPCASCHGYDGHGRPEGGERPADITAESLRGASDGVRTNGRKRPAYTKARLTRAIALGIDAANHDLSATMPHYRMKLAQMDDLLAYLDVLGTEKDPGVTDDALAVGVVTRDAAARQALEQAARKVNEDGLYGRRLELRFAADVKALAGDAQPFAVIDTSCTADSTAAFAEAERMPAIVGARTAGDDAGRYTFALLGGPREIAAALLAEARRVGAGDRLMIVHNDATAALASALADGWTRVETIAAANVVLDLDEPRHLPALLAAAAALPSPPIVLVPASLADPRLISAPNVIVGFPTLPERDSGRTNALASMAILLDALQKIGRDVAREKVVEELQTLYRFDSGFGPAVTWTASRRSGTSAAYLMRPDPSSQRLVNAPGWLTP